MIDLKHADFFEAQAELPRKGFDLILTDPPYGTLENLHSWDKALNWSEMETIFSELLAPGGQVILFCDLHNMARIKTTFSNHLSLRTYHVWEKPGGMPVNLFSPIHNAEFILVYRRKADKVSELPFNPQALGTKGDPYQKKGITTKALTRSSRKSLTNNTSGERWPKTILYAPSKPNMNKSERTNHPTQKPLSLVRKLIQGYSAPGGSVLDPFAGSGTTLIAAHLEGRRSTGFEINSAYFQEAKKRISIETSQQALFLDQVLV